MAWTHDNARFFYSRYAWPEGRELQAVVRNQRLYYHRLGTDQAQDLLVYERPDHPDWGFGADVTEDGHYLVVSVWLGTDERNRVYYQDLVDPARPRIRSDLVRLLDDFDATDHFVGNHGPVFYFVPNLDAPRGRLIAIDTRRSARTEWRTVIPQTDATLQGASLIGGRFVARYTEDAHLGNGLRPAARVANAATDAGRRGRYRGGATRRSLQLHAVLPTTSSTTTYHRENGVARPASIWPRQTRQVFPSRTAPASMSPMRLCPSPTARALLLHAYGGQHAEATGFSVNLPGWSGEDYALRTSGAAASTARSGTKRGCWTASRTSSTTASPRPSTSYARDGPVRAGSPSAAARTADCSWERC
jgi:hypothetical protein